MKKMYAILMALALVLSFTAPVYAAQQSEACCQMECCKDCCKDGKCAGESCCCKDGKCCGSEEGAACCKHEGKEGKACCGDSCKDCAKAKDCQNCHHKKHGKDAGKSNPK